MISYMVARLYLEKVFERPGWVDGAGVDAHSGGGRDAFRQFGEDGDAISVQHGRHLADKVLRRGDQLLQVNSRRFRRRRPW